MTEQEKQVVETLTRSFTRMETLYKVKCMEVEAREEEISRLKTENAELCHRAEVAERALLHALEAAISNGECPECVIKFAGNCKGTVKDIRDCAALDVEDYLQQAEKELQEGKER